MSHRIGGVLAIVASLIIFVPLIVLGAAIGWPGSLDDPAAEALPRLLENESAVRLGYIVYLAYSVLLLPVGIAITRWADGGRTAISTGALIAMGFAVVSSGMRTIGIIRWLSAMFPLADAWESADATEQTIIAIQFEALNNYGGAIGELLGVSLFAALWVAVTALGPGREHRAPWFAISGAVVAAFVAVPLVSLVGADAGAFVTVSGTAFNVWLLVTGVVMLRGRGRGHGRGTTATAAQEETSVPV